MTDLKQAAHNKQVDNALRIAIEAAWDKLDDKPVQKPVACRFCHSEKGCWTWQCYHCGEIDDVQKPAPPAPQREWAGLADEDIVEIYTKRESKKGASLADLMRDVEATLKERNHDHPKTSRANGA